MRITKKLLAILLCLAMLPCTFLTVFAADETQTIDPTPAGSSQNGEVLYYQRFDKNFNLTLDKTGLIPPVDSDTIKATIDDNGFLASEQFTKSTKLCRLPVGLSETQDTTLLLANRINHPIRDMHELFAQCLFNTIFDLRDTVEIRVDDAMYRENDAKEHSHLEIIGYKSFFNRK